MLTLDKTGNNRNTEKLKKQFSYTEFYDLTETLVKNESTSGSEQTESRISATKLNLQRMHRLTKTAQLASEWDTLDINKTQNLHWLVITEVWCGDGAQIIPVMQKIAEKLNIELQFILRDENLEITDKYAFRGTRSIPRLICYDKITGAELGVWGPRPADAQAIADNGKKTGVPHDEWVIAVQNWYNNDKTAHLQNELFSFVMACLH